MWGMAVAMSYIFVANGERKWYNQIMKDLDSGDLRRIDRDEFDKVI